MAMLPTTDRGKDHRLMSPRRCRAEAARASNLAVSVLSAQHEGFQSVSAQTFLALMCVVALSPGPYTIAAFPSACPFAFPSLCLCPEGSPCREGAPAHPI